MKKLIAISVIFALVAGVAFAEATLGGQLQIGTNVFSGNLDSGGLRMGGLRAHEAKIKATFGDGESGGVIVITSSGDFNPTTPGFHAEGRFSGFLYWRPSEFFRIQVGQNNDGDYGAARISGWGFTGEAKNSVGAYNDWNPGGLTMAANRSHAFYAGTGSWNNLNMSFFPMHGLTVNLIFPFTSGWSARAYDAVLADINLNVVYNIEDLGIVTVSFAGRDENENRGGGLADGNNNGLGTLYASFYLMAIDGMGLDLGLMFNLPGQNGRTSGLAIGAGFTFAADALNVKVRAGAKFGSTNDAGVGDGLTTISLGVLPSFKLDNITAFLHAGLGMRLSDASGVDPVMDWFINPYMTMPAGNLRLYAGIQLYKHGSGPVTYAVPFGFNIYF